MDLTFPRGVLRIDCGDCAMDGTDACADCIVTFMCTRDDAGAVVVDVAEARALRALQAGGLLPTLRHRSVTMG
jgi:predicted dinucleotide-binding enzyme